VAVKKKTKPSSLKAALLMPANLFALAAGGVAAVLLGDIVPLVAAGGASVAYLTFLSTMPSFRRAVRANSEAQTSAEVASPEEEEALLSALAPSQKEHYGQLKALKARILEEYGKLPGGGVLQASSEARLDMLLTSFLRLVTTLNSYRRFLSAADKRAVEEELAALTAEVEGERNERLREVKARRVDILKKRLARFVQADESREVVSHQLASIEDLLRLTHEQSIAIRDPQSVTRQLDALAAEVAATEETVRDMESFLLVTEELSSTPSGQPVKVRS
jgi:hypothetical protein